MSTENTNLPPAGMTTNALLQELEADYQECKTPRPGAVREVCHRLHRTIHAQNSANNGRELQRIPSPPVAPFWMIVDVAAPKFLSDRGPRIVDHARPSVLLPTRVSAETEAVRLAQKYPEGRFVILEAVATVEGYAQPRTVVQTVHRVESLKPTP